MTGMATKHTTTVVTVIPAISLAFDKFKATQKAIKSPGNM